MSQIAGPDETQRAQNVYAAELGVPLPFTNYALWHSAKRCTKRKYTNELTLPLNTITLLSTCHRLAVISTGK